MNRRLSSRDSAECRAYGQAEAAQIAAGEYVAGHDLPCREEVAESSTLPLDASGGVDRDAHVGEGQAAAERDAVEGRPLDRLSPVALRRLQTRGGQPVELGFVEPPDVLSGAVELFDGRLDG